MVSLLFCLAVGLPPGAPRGNLRLVMRLLDLPAAVEIDGVRVPIRGLELAPGDDSVESLQKAGYELDEHFHVLAEHRRPANLPITCVRKWPGMDPQGPPTEVVVCGPLVRGRPHRLRLRIKWWWVLDRKLSPVDERRHGVQLTIEPMEPPDLWFVSLDASEP
jgi:hypothetical protein